MKMFRKLVSIVAAATVLTSSLALTFSSYAATTPADSEVSADAALKDNVQDGVILHAFNWSYNSIKENLPAIAAAGYSTVQTSPVQQPKDFSASTDVGGQWWKLYQPVSMQIAQKSWLGTKEELTALCSEADKYGIKIICDIVSNHFGNLSEMAGPNSLSDQVLTYQPDFYNNRTSYFRSNNFNADDSSIQKTVQGHVSACPDLNTNNSNVQQAALNLLKECIDCGVDGFRFDAAKHIETPSDGSYASQYWPTVANGAKTYYSQKNPGKNLFIYGEILNPCGTGRSFNNYTSYINVTDNKTGDSVLAAVKNKNAGTAASSQYKSGVSASKVVLWAESHDTFEGDSGSAGISNTSGISDEMIVKAWAIVAARKDATALYFARPGTARMGDAGTDVTYKSTAVAAVNKFHNLFAGQSEKLGSSGSIAYVQRGGKGIVLSNVSGTSTSVSVANTGMANGTYTDMVTGNTFTVSNGTVSGNIGSTGVAVIYDGIPTPSATSSVESGIFKGETLTVQLSLENAVNGTYCLDDSSPVSFTNGTAIKIGSDYKYGDTINLTLAATDKYGTTETLTYHYTKQEDTSSNIYIWFDKKKRSAWKTPLNCYMYDEDTVGKDTVYCNAASWPGETMTYDEKQDMWYYKVPTESYLNGQLTDFDLTKSKNAYFIVSGSGNQQQFPAAGAHSPKLNAQSWEYVGGSTFVASTRVPTTTEIPATVVTKGYEPTTAAPTTTEEPTTAKPTEAPTTAKPTEAPTTAKPTEAPTTAKPTEAPTTAKPTAAPTTAKPTAAPTTAKPTAAPTTAKPTAAPTTAKPTAAPTTAKPTAAPTTAKPTAAPTTAVPTTEPAPTILGYYGDVSGEGDISIKDVTLVQLHIAKSKLLTGLNLTLADVNGDGEVNVYDVTYIQLYIAKNPKHAKVGEPYMAPRPTTPATAKPTAAPTTAKQPTTAAATTATTPSGKSLTVTATSNIFPQATTTFNPIANQITVTYWIDIKDAVMINCQWTMAYDKKYLTIDDTDGANRKGKKYQIFRATEGVGTVTNFNVESMPGGGVKCNATDLSGYDLKTEDGGKVPFVSVTFNPVDGASGKTTVNLDVEVMQLSKGDDDRFYFINESKIVRPDISYLPSDTATAVYAGVFNNGIHQDPDATTPVPTQGTTAAPQAGTLKVKATSNIFPQATTTFDPIANQITVTYWIDIKDAVMINCQWTMAYDKKYLTIDDTDGANRKGKKYQIFRATGGSGTVNNLEVDSMPNGGIKCNATDLDGFDLCTDNGGRVPFVSVTFNPTGKTGETTVNLEVEYMQLKDDNNPQYYFINESQIVRPDISYLPSDTATAVYAGLFDNTKQQKPDDVQPTTAKPTAAPTTAKPTAAPTTAKPTEAPTTAKPTEAPTTVKPTEAPTTAKPTEAPTTVKPTEPPTEPPTDPPVTDFPVKFTNNFGWTNVYVHAWTSDGTPLTQWPGIEMTNIGDNGFGQDNFETTVPGDTYGIVFTAGENGPQTSDVTDFSAEGWFVHKKYTETKDDGTVVFTALPWGFDPGDDPGEGQVVKFSNNQKWGSVYVHAWTSDGTPLTEWPGIQMTNIGDNGMNEGVDNYEATIPAGAAGICFTASGDGPQTTDVTDLSAEGWYTDGSKDGEGKFVAIPWGSEGSGGGDGQTVKFSNNQKWGSVYVHAWTSDGTPLTEWPGIQMTNIGDNGMNEGVDNYEATIPAGAAGICFTASGDGPQTTDVTDLSAEGWYTNGSKDGEGKFIAIPWGSEGSGGGDGQTVKFSNNQKWGSVYVHAWTSDGTPLTEWPGIQMTNIGDNGMNEGVDNYEATIPAGAAGICFTASGDGPQTTDVTDLSAEGWYTNGSKDGEGKFVAIPWGSEGGGGGDGQTVKFSNNQKWGSVYVHAWTSDGTPLTEWPGIQMTNIGDNGMNEGVDNYEATIPAGAAGICFTASGDGPQTTDVTDLSTEGWYTDGSKDGEGKFVAIPWGSEGGGSQGGGGGEGGGGGDSGRTVKFTNNLKWASVYVHYWTDGGSSSEWPGIQMTDIGENGFDEGVHNYQATIPSDAAGIVFTAGSDGPQTTDVTDFSSEGWFVNSGYTTEKDGKTVYNALPWGTDISGGGSQGGGGGEGGGGGDSGRTVKFTNNLKWASVYVHYWTDGGSSSEWPGIQMTDIGENGFDEGVHNYQATIPSDAAGIVFTAGSDGPQTTDVTDFSSEGWFVNSGYTTEKDGKTVYNALPWGTDISGGGSQGGGSGEGGGDSGTYTVKFSSKWGGTMRCYYWAEGNTPYEWNNAPVMNVEQQDNGYGETVYTLDIPTTYNMIIFQNGTNQTVDINTNSQSSNYYAKTTKSGTGYEVGTW